MGIVQKIMKARLKLDRLHKKLIKKIQKKKDKKE